MPIQRTKKLSASETPETSFMLPEKKPMPETTKRKISIAQKARLKAQNRPVKGKKSAIEQRLLAAMMLVLLARGMSESQIIEEMSLTNQKEYLDIRRWLYDLEKQEHTNKSNLDLFVDYMIRQKGCIIALDKLIEQFETSNQANALVGAVKAKSDIHDKIVRRGEELDVLRSEKSQLRIIAGVDVRGLSNTEITVMIRTELKQLEQMSVGPIIDVTPEDAMPPIIRRKRLSSGAAE